MYLSVIFSIYFSDEGRAKQLIKDTVDQFLKISIKNEKSNKKRRF